MNTWQVLKGPVVTEKSTILGEIGKYVFRVNNRATKHQIRDAVEAAFGVTVVKVSTMKVPGKMKRYGPRPSLQPSWKKAVVTLQAGDNIQLFEGA